MVSWSSRWSGDVSDLDLDAIAGDMEFTLLDEIEVETMSCEDIANCIETEETVQNAITEAIQNEGYIPDATTNLSDDEPPPTISQADKDKNLLPEELVSDCTGQPELAMGLAREVVREMNENSEDLLELLEYATNTLEAWANISSNIPAALTNVITVALDWVDWLLETFGELYEAAYTQSVEDELACAIFCHIMDNCSLSLTDLQTIYGNEASIGTPPSGLIETVEFIYDIAVSADKIAVAAFHYQLISLMSWGKIAALSPVYFKSLLAATVGADYSYEDLCDDCVSPSPTTYWAIVHDFRLGAQNGTTVAIVNGSNNDGVWTGDGYTVNLTPVASTLNANFGITDLGAQYVIRAMATKSVRRGSDGNGTHDFASGVIFANANYAPTALNNFAQAFITLNTNDVTTGVISPSASTVARSVQWRSRVNEATNSASQKMLRVYQCAVWGLAGAGNTKPPRAVWAGNSLPATVAELFTP
jgi:hypothetical protein